MLWVAHNLFSSLDVMVIVEDREGQHVYENEVCAI
jgi:hypothetical protein